VLQIFFFTPFFRVNNGASVPRSSVRLGGSRDGITESLRSIGAGQIGEEPIIVGGWESGFVSLPACGSHLTLLAGFLLIGD